MPSMTSRNEINTVIIAACIPTLRPLFLIIFKRPGGDKYLGKTGFPSQGSSGERPTKYGNTSIGFSPTLARPCARYGNSWAPTASEQHLPGDDRNIRQTIEMDVTYDTRRRSQDFLSRDLAPSKIYVRNAV